MFKAHGHKIIIKVIEGHETKHGLTYVEDTTDPVGRGVVVSKGEDTPEELTEGDVLIFERGRHWPFEFEGEKLAYVEDEYALAFIKQNIEDVRTTQRGKSNTTAESTH